MSFCDVSTAESCDGMVKVWYRFEHPQYSMPKRSRGCFDKTLFQGVVAATTNTTSTGGRVRSAESMDQRTHGHGAPRLMISTD